MPLSLWDIGGCNCPGVTCCALPCPLPKANLTLTTTYNGGGTATIGYAGNCQWQGCLVTGSGAGVIYTFVQVTYTGTCTVFQFLNYTGAGCTGSYNGAGWYYMDPGGCGSTVAGTGLQLQPSSTCSPLSLVLKDTINGWTWTVSYGGSIDWSGCSCPGSPCTLPQADLNASATWPTTPAYNGSGLLAYTSGSGYCQWAGCVNLGSGPSGTRSLKVTLYSSTGCTYCKVDVYTNTTCTPPLPAGNYWLWESTAGCSGYAAGSLGSLYLASSTCSPLNLYFSTSNTTPSAGDQLTITL